MKTTIVPAQITSVEDKIAGNLSFTQLLLLISPVFLGGASFVFLPSFLKFENYKVAIAGIIAVICLVLAVRIKTKLVLEWLVIASRYNSRPRYYVFNKNSTVGRSEYRVRKDAPETEVKKIKEDEVITYAFKHSEVLSFESVINNPQADFHFLTDKKGALRVHFKEVE